MTRPDFGGPKLSASDISVDLGSLDEVDPVHLHPMGFTLATVTQLDALRDAIRHTYADEANRAPTALRDLAPRHVNLYRCSDSMQGEAIVFSPRGHNVQFTRSGAVIKPDHFPLHEPKGIGLRTNDACAVTPQLIMRIGHECRHVLTRYGTHIFNKGPTEALNAALDNAYYPGTNAQQVAKISRDQVWSTTGLNSPDDFAEVDHSALAESALYASAHAAFENVATETMWEIWLALTDLALEKKRYPFQHEVRAAIQHALQEEADTVFSTPAFMPMTVGNHVVAFNTTLLNGTRATQFNAFDVDANPAYGLRQHQAGMSFDSTIMRTRDARRIAYELRFFDRKNHAMQQGGGGTASAKYWTSFEKEKANIIQHMGAPGERFANSISAMEITAGTLPPIRLTPKA